MMIFMCWYLAYLENREIKHNYWKTLNFFDRNKEFIHQFPLSKPNHPFLTSNRLSTWTSTKLKRMPFRPHKPIISNNINPGDSPLSFPKPFCLNALSWLWEQRTKKKAKNYPLSSLSHFVSFFPFPSRVETLCGDCANLLNLWTFITAIQLCAKRAATMSSSGEELGRKSSGFLPHPFPDWNIPFLVISEKS